MALFLVDAVHVARPIRIESEMVRFLCRGKPCYYSGYMNKRIFLAFGILALLGAGCAMPKSVEKTSEPTKNEAPTQVNVVSEADFVTAIMKSGNPWSEYKDEKTRVSFQYPKGFFTETQKYGDEGSGMRYMILAKPTTPENGICDGLADVDCEISTWPKRYANFQAALKGSEYKYGGYESFPVAQQVKTVGGRKFILNVSQGMNGACVLSYIHATPTVYASFSVNICDDPQLDAAKWFGNIVSEEEKLKAKNILAGNNLSDSTSRKIQAMEQVLITLKMR